MFFIIYGITIDIFGIIGMIISIIGVLLLAYMQKTPFWLWLYWIAGNFFWFTHYILFNDIVSLIMTAIFFIMNVFGVIRNLQLRYRGDS